MGEATIGRTLLNDYNKINMLYVILIDTFSMSLRRSKQVQVLDKSLFFGIIKERTLRAVAQKGNI
jgi:hypothetical protein